MLFLSHQARRNKITPDGRDLDYVHTVERILAKCLAPDQKIMTILRAASAGRKPGKLKGK
jgi:hypothetical protein